MLGEFEREVSVLCSDLVVARAPFVHRVGVIKGRDGAGLPKLAPCHEKLLALCRTVRELFLALTMLFDDLCHLRSQVAALGNLVGLREEQVRQLVGLGERYAELRVGAARALQIRLVEASAEIRIALVTLAPGRNHLFSRVLDLLCAERRELQL